MLGYCWVGVFQFTIDLSGSDGTRFFHVFRQLQIMYIVQFWHVYVSILDLYQAKQSKSLVSKNKHSYFMNQRETIFACTA